MNFIVELFLGERLKTVANNMQNVYNAGYEKGKSEGGSGFISDMSYMFYMDARFGIRDTIYTYCKDIRTCRSCFMGCSDIVEFDSKGFPDTSNCRFMENMFMSCKKLVKADMSHIDCSSLYSSNSGMMGAFQDCSNLEEVIGLLYKSSETPSLTGAFNRCPKLRRLTFSEDCGNYKGTDIDISNCSFERSGMVELFNSLPTITNSSKLTITGNPCLTGTTNLLTDADRAIATSKGWTLVEA